MKIVSSLFDGPVFWHMTSNYANLISILDSSRLRESVDTRKKDRLSKVFIHISNNVNQTMLSTAERSSKKGFFGIGIDTSKQLRILNKMDIEADIDNDALKLSLPKNYIDSLRYDYMEQFSIIGYWETGSAPLTLRLRSKRNQTAKELKLPQNNMQKSVPILRRGLANRILDELSRYTTEYDKDIKFYKFLPAIDSNELSKELVNEIRFSERLYEAEDLIAVERSDLVSKYNNAVKAHEIPIAINEIVIRDKEWDNLTEGQKSKLKSYSLPIYIYISPWYLDRVAADDYDVNKESKILASKITFSPRRQYGINMYFPNNLEASDGEGYGKYSVIKEDFGEGLKYYIRIYEDREWKYPAWDGADNGFRTLQDAQEWLSKRDWINATSQHIDIDEEYESKQLSEFIDAMEMLGFTKSTSEFYDADHNVYELEVELDEETVLGYPKKLAVRAIYFEEEIAVDYWLDLRRIPNSAKPPNSANIAKTIRNIETMLKKYNYSIFANSMMISSKSRSNIMAAISTKDMTSKLVRVKSSNIWSYGINVKRYGDKLGDILVQFKGEGGGPGAIYIYYDVPVRVYRRWQSAPSKGHYFWKYIRNIYKYSKLTGDKRGKLKNAIN